MTIVLNETEWAKEMLRTQSLGKKPFETLTRVANYYFELGYKKRDVRRMLDTFLLQCEPTASLPKWGDTIEHAIEKAMKYDAIKLDYIEISVNEMGCIDKLQGKQIRRLAFTLLCLAKYWDAVNPNGDHWVNSRDCDIMKMANINTSIRRQSEMYHTLIENGMLQQSKKVDNTNVRVCFTEEGEPAIRVSDFRNLGYQYMKYHGEPYFECMNCGITTKYANPKKGGKQKYCPACAAEIKLKQDVNRIMRNRELASGARNSITQS